MKVFNLKNMNENEKADMFSFFERQLVSQAVGQHLNNDKDLVLKGQVIAYELDRDNECLYIKYSNGEVWKYRGISCGAEGMLYELDEERSNH